MATARLSGVIHLKIPVIDLARAVDWYGRVFGFHVMYEFKDADGVVRGVAGEIPGLDGMLVAFRVNEQAARGCRGFDPVHFAVDARTDLEAWGEHLDDLGIHHSSVIEASIGWLLVLEDS